jgi:hypothetical protein
MEWVFKAGSLAGNFDFSAGRLNFRSTADASVDLLLAVLELQSCTLGLASVSGDT